MPSLGAALRRVQEEHPDTRDRVCGGCGVGERIFKVCKSLKKIYPQLLVFKSVALAP